MTEKQTLPITLVGRFKHADIYSAAKEIGGIKALAEYLNVSTTTIYSWCNLENYPKENRWPKKRLKILEGKLFGLTGKLLSDLFPAGLQAKEFLEKDKKIEITKEIEIRYLSDETKRRLEIPSPEYFMEAKERTEQIEQVLQCLSYRQREIIKLRYGLGGEAESTLEEIAHTFKLTKQRICEIIARALQLLEQKRSSILRNLV